MEIISITIAAVLSIIILVSLLGWIIQWRKGIYYLATRKNITKVKNTCFLEGNKCPLPSYPEKYVHEDIRLS